jgi:uncharacterized membrane protein
MKHLLVFLAIATLASCSFTKSPAINLDAPTDEVPPLKADQLNYKFVNDQVLIKSCVGCHSEKGGNKGHVNLENYKNVFERKADIRKEVSEGTMPPSSRPDLKLSDTQTQIIIDWIDNGARETLDSPLNPDPQPPVVNPPPPVATGDIYFAEIFEKVIKTNCLKCHSVAGGNKGRVNLETYQGVVDNIKDVELDIATNDMPPKAPAGTALTDEQKNLIAAWIANGFPEKPKEVQPVYFKDVFEKVIKTNCLKCHSEAGGNKGDVNLETYASVFENRFEIKQDIETDQMPPKPPRGSVLTGEQKKLIISWLEQGALEKAP